MKYQVMILMIAMAIGCGQQDNTPPIAAAGQEVSATLGRGKNLFQQNCASCHAKEKELVGPPLAGVEKKWDNKAKLYAFIRNAPQVIKEDKYAHDLWKKYNQTTMMPFPDLTDADIDAILEYVNTK
ncbi:c-type cytochrome [Aridibaculum aurantiacum]|uniref:c-type cytochrome n=1 Tax=Aridibaculum aurantiacum TaxID=2810307 RepID=UPI001A97BBB3|nr:cytochrome c [Aridibaculum aurantiacum]